MISIYCQNDDDLERECKSAESEGSEPRMGNVDSEAGLSTVLPRRVQDAVARMPILTQESPGK
jgi:hypothetical protein